jgi:heme a synthase
MVAPHDRSPRMVRFVIATLLVNFFVIAWGAWVRASGSGAGCGNHWPTCNGQIIPQSPTTHALVEFIHRASSGIALLLVVGMAVWSWRRFRPGHWARRAAAMALVLMGVEAGIGAALVKFELVAGNASLARAVALGAHLLNTQLLLAAIALTGWWAAGRPTVSWHAAGRERGWFVAAAIGLLAVGMTGAIASLGDTLFPSRTLAQGLSQDFNPTAQLLLRLRIWHPALAVAVGAGVMLLAQTSARRGGPAVSPAARLVTTMVLLQWAIGVGSLLLLAPVTLQLLHLLTADCVWLSFVVLAAIRFADQAGDTTAATSRAASWSNTVPAPSSR